MGIDMLDRLQRVWFSLWDGVLGVFSGSVLLKGVALLVLLYVAIAGALGVFWSIEPDQPALPAKSDVAGVATTTALIDVTAALLEKQGGYISNDKLPPGIWLDNMPNWEFGVLVQARDMARAMRKDFSRSQSQSTEDSSLAKAEPMLNFNNNSWLFPATESEYKKALKGFRGYLARLENPAEQSAQFYARADNLNGWLGDVSTRLGSLSQRLSASVGQKRVNLDTEPAGVTNPSASELEVKTSWFEIDDVFYEARGTAWALIHLLKAVERDFGPALDKKNARVSLLQIIRELEATQGTIWSPVILNGTEFGFLANHSLVMASYISRANAAIIDLRELLSQG